MNRHLLNLALLGLSAFAAPAAFADVESESNDTSGTADTLVVPFTTNDTGITVTGKLREGNVTPNPRDQDFFKFTNLHQFTSIRVKITPSGIDGSQSISFEILTNGQSQLFTDNFSSGFRTNTITPTAAGATFFVRVFDPGNLTTASSEASYSVEIVGENGVNPALAFAAKQAEVTAKQGEISAKQAQITTWGNWITTLNAQIRAADRNLLKQKALLKRARLASQKAKVRKQIAKYSRQLATLKSTLASRKSQLSQHNADLQTLQGQLTVLQAELAELQALL